MVRLWEWSSQCSMVTCFGATSNTLPLSCWHASNLEGFSCSLTLLHRVLSGTAMFSITVSWNDELTPVFGVTSVHGVQWIIQSSVLVGDSAFTLSPVLMKIYPGDKEWLNLTTVLENFKKAQVRTRCVVKCAFGSLKERFSIDSETTASDLKLASKAALLWCSLHSILERRECYSPCYWNYAPVLLVPILPPPHASISDALARYSHQLYFLLIFWSGCVCSFVLGQFCLSPVVANTRLRGDCMNFFSTSWTHTVVTIAPCSRMQ